MAASRRLLWTWLPVVAWAAVIFALSSIPGLGTGLGFWDFVLRKIAHVVEFAILGALLARALPELHAFIAGVGYAAFDEIHQHFVPGRTGTVQDVAIDTVGVLLGILAWRRLRGGSGSSASREAPAALPGLGRHGPRGDHVGDHRERHEHGRDAHERAPLAPRAPQPSRAEAAEDDRG